MKKILAIMILAAVCGTACAVEYYWQGAVSGDLGDTNNFVLSGSFKTNVLPQAADNLNINSSLYVGEDEAARVDQPESDEAKLAALAKADPQRYPLAVICSRRLPGTEAPPDTWTRDKKNEGGWIGWSLFSGWKELSK